ncbi:MAG: flagellar M-ring protein FliF [Lachnospiraceae bacterium]|nr:flagellar M-ring protein FliF C-terminal domain-containing protein [uncultured Acetatifactor sp.]MCI8543295.1 flagellar M-ring protein FliF [Lachnospiraceae bacterium]
MADKLKEIPGKALEWWNKFTSRQKTIIIAIVAVVIFTFAIIVYTFSRPQYTRLGTYESSTTAAEIVKILDDADITHRESADAMTIDVLTSQLSQANLAIATEGYVPDSLKYTDIVETGMSITSSDRESMQTEYIERGLENMFARTMPVKDVAIKINRPSNSGRLSDSDTDSFATITVTVTDDFNAANATAMAKAAATALGNDSTANITIVDQNWNLLFAGGDDYSTMGIASSMQELQTQAEAMVTNQVKKVLIGTKQFNEVEVSSHLSVDFSEYNKRVTEYSAPDGYTNGMPSHEDTLSFESDNSTGGIPGTDSNTENLTGYDYLGAGGGTTSQEERSVDYQNNVSDTNTITPAGSIDYDNSSISVALIKYREYYEENVERQGLLEGISWEDFKEANRDDIKREVDEDVVQMVAYASGIDASRVVVVSYESPIFYDKEDFFEAVSSTDILSIVMIILILGLLAFVILRSMVSKKKEAVEEEPELSVEDMLQSTPAEPEIDDIDVETKSETRKMVEKFVDENPEAAANLLRNWLNEDWN